MFCGQCGVQNPDGSKFCQGCGGCIEAEGPASSPQTPPPPTPAAPTAQPAVQKSAPAVAASPTPIQVPWSGITLVGAGAGRRFLAVLIDTILFGVALYLLYRQFGAGGLVLDTGGLDIMKLKLDYDNWYLYYAAKTDFLYLLVPFVGGILYVILFEGAFGWTLGKLTVGVKVVKTDGRRSGFIAAILRLVFWVIDLFLVGLIMVLVTKRKQRLGDLVAGTVVAGRKAIKAGRQGAAG